MEKILITGGAGYLGSIMSEKLLNSGYQVSVLDNLIYKQTSLMHLCGRKYFSLIDEDVTNFNEFETNCI